MVQRDNKLAERFPILKTLSRLSASLWRGARGLIGIKINWKF